MLEFLRKKSGGVFSIVIIGAIALVFIFWGIGGQNSGSPDDIRINGQPVPLSAYADMQENVLENLRSQNQNQTLTPTDQLRARQQALGFLVERQLLLDLAKKTGRTSSVAEINQAVKSNPAFQVDGRFSFKAYEEIVPRYYNRSLAAFEANLADDLVVSQVANLIQQLAYSPKGAVLDDFHFTEDKLALDFIFFPNSAYLGGQEPDEEALSAYYEINKERWRVPAEVKIDYVKVDIDSFIDQVEVTEADLEDAYIEDSESFFSPEEAEVSHILLRFPTLTPSEEQKSEALILAQAALARLAEEDFDVVASELSQDSASSATGGSLGTVKRGETLPAFEEAIFGPGKDSPGTVIGPIETLFGYHLIKVDSYTPDHTKTLEEAAPELTAIIQRRKARRLAINRIEDLLEALPTTISPSNLRNTATSLGLDVLESDFFSVNSGAPDFLEGSPDILASVVDTPVGRVGDPIDTPESLVVFSPTEIKESYLPPLTDESVREKAASDWKEQVADVEAKKAASDFLKLFLSDWSQAELPEGAERERTDLFARMKFYEASNYLVESEPLSFLNQYFALAKVGDQVTSPIKVESDLNPGYIILKVTQTEAADESILTPSDLIQRQTTARSSLSKAAYEFWAQAGRSSAKIQLPPEVEAMFTEDNQ